jgi:hypothetical protein
MITKRTITDKIEVKDIVGYEGLYAITNQGEVWSYPKNTNNKSGKWLKKDFSRNYTTVSLIKESVKKRFPVHRLVAQAFCHKSDETYQVNHINGDKRDNVHTNLEWVSASENRLHAWREGLQVATPSHIQSARNAGFGRRIFTDEQIRLIRQLKGKKSQRTIAKMYNTSQALIQYILANKTYKEVI